MKNSINIFAVLRLENDNHKTVVGNPLSHSKYQLSIGPTVKEIVCTAEVAESECIRLNALKVSPNDNYVWQTTRIKLDDIKFLYEKYFHK